MNERPRVYLAGPDVFLPDAHAAADSMKAACADVGLEGVFPLDADMPQTIAAKSGDRQAAWIYRANVDLIQGCAGVVANLTPFRGVSADPGTAFEIGFATALRLPVTAWSLDQQPYHDRLASQAPHLVVHERDGTLVDTLDKTTVENFGHPDNLMLCVPLVQSRVHDSFAEAAAALVRVLLK